MLVSTAIRIGKARIFEDTKISLLGREEAFECLEFPENTDPLHRSHSSVSTRN